MRKLKKNKTKWWGLLVVGALTLIGRGQALATVGIGGGGEATAEVSQVSERKTTGGGGCAELKLIFARGSGGERWTDQNYLAWKEGIEAKIKGTGIDYEFVDLDYPAIGIGEVETLVSTFFSAGSAYEFGASVDAGVARLMSEVEACPETKFVLGGYSQGAMVVSKAIHSIAPSKVIYATTFGDPKIYLPEGRSKLSLSELLGGIKNVSKIGTIPDACKGENLSDYRMYVPDCYAYKGMLGSYEPYAPLGYAGKLGTWCNTYDMFCSSYLSPSSHVSYVSDNLYEDASRVVASKVATAFGVKNEYTSPHDTVILIDSSGSMSSLIGKYKVEALRLAEQTLATGGRVALYDYRDLSDPYQVQKRCDFDNCNIETFRAGLAEIEVSGGGDTPESLLSASLTVMNELNWRLGATKSLVVLTDAGYHSPDLDGTRFIDVVALSKAIDPVNFYVVTTGGVASEYATLAEATGGRVVTTADDLTELTDYIMERYDSLPRVVERGDEEFDTEVPVLAVDEVVEIGFGEVEIRFRTNGTRAVVGINDALLGATSTTSITVRELDRSVVNYVSLAPLSETRRGETVVVTIPILDDGKGEVVIPKAPDTGVGPQVYIN